MASPTLQLPACPPMNQGCRLQKRPAARTGLARQGTHVPEARCPPVGRSAHSPHAPAGPRPHQRPRFTLSRLPSKQSIFAASQLGQLRPPAWSSWRLDLSLAKWPPQGRHLAQLKSQRTAGPPQTCGPCLPDSMGGSSDLPTPEPALPSQPWGWLGLGRGPGTCPLDQQQCLLRTEGSCPLGMSAGDREKVPVP